MLAGAGTPILLAGVAAETGVVMLIYLDHAWEKIRGEREAEGEPATAANLYSAVMEGAVERVRPKMMTVVAIMAGCCRSCGARERAPR